MTQSMKQAPRPADPRRDAGPRAAASNERAPTSDARGASGAGSLDADPAQLAQLGHAVQRVSDEVARNNHALYGDALPEHLAGPGKADGAQPKPGGAGAAKKAAATPQPGPHAFTIPKAGRWLLKVVEQVAAFAQRVTIENAASDAGQVIQPARGEELRVEAAEPWSLTVEHQPRDAKQEAWSGRSMKEWHPSTHRGAEVESGFGYRVASEDFRDGDFDDLVLAIEPAGDDTLPPDVGPRPDPTRPEPASGERAYVVTSETQTAEGTTRFDLIIGASEEGHLDVILDHVVAAPEDFAGLDLASLDAVLARFAEFRGMLAGSPELAAVRAQVEASVLAYESAIRAARSAAAARPAPPARRLV